MYAKLSIATWQGHGGVIDLSCMNTSKKLEDRKTQQRQRPHLLPMLTKKIGNICVICGVRKNTW